MGFNNSECMGRKEELFIFNVQFKQTNLLLLLDDDRELCVGDAGVEFAAHECGSLVVLDVAHILSLGNFDVL